jgi:hypothetical protein
MKEGETGGRGGDVTLKNDEQCLGLQSSSLNFFFPMALQPPMGPWPTSMKLSVSLRFSRS